MVPTVRRFLSNRPHRWRTRNGGLGKIEFRLPIAVNHLAEEDAYSPNLLQRSPPPAQLNRVWVTDITYIPLKESPFAYLALVLDLCSRRVVGWSLAEQMTESLILDALAHAIRDRQPAPGLVHHSDRSGQYASQD